MLDVTTENYTGADCTESSGASNRTLILANTGTTYQSGFLVYVSGLALTLTTEYTVVHNSSSSVITFLNGMWDDLSIIINYYQQRSTVAGYDTKRDDIQDIITSNGYAATMIRQTRTTDGLGGVTAVTDAEYAIWVLIQDITRKDREISDMGLAVPGNSKAYFYHEYLDVMTENGDIKIEVGDIIKYQDSKYWRVEQILAQRSADNAEIFRVGIIKKIDLDEDAA